MTYPRDGGHAGRALISRVLYTYQCAKCPATIEAAHSRDTTAGPRASGWSQRYTQGGWLCPTCQQVTCPSCNATHAAPTAQEALLRTTEDEWRWTTRENLPRGWFCPNCQASLRQMRGFRALTPEKQREIASKGGRTAHAKGTAHEWTSDEARACGAKGGRVSRGGRGKLPAPAMDGHEVKP